MTTPELWWVRRAGDPKGPFPTPVLENNIRQGRVRPDDLLSLDGDTWSKGRDVARFAGLWSAEGAPSAAADVGDAELSSQQPDSARPPAEEPPALEEPALVARRERANRVWSGLRPQPASPPWVPLAILSVMVVAVFLASTQGTRLGADDARCSAAPAPGLNWEFCNLAGRDLRGKDLSAVNFRSAKLAGLDLTGARLDGADLAYADMTGTTLSKSSLRHARLVGARLTSALVSNSELSGADLSYADFSQAKVSGNRFDGARFSDTLLPSTQPCSDEPGKTACAQLIEYQAR